MKAKKIMKRVLLSVVIFVAVFSVISMAMGAVIFRVMFGRVDSFDDELHYADISAADYPREALVFDSKGESLKGYLYPGASDAPKGLVIVAGGISSDADCHLQEIMFFNDHGWMAFAYCPTGVGESSGEGRIGLSRFRVDLCSAISALRARDELSALPFVVYGHSAGGYAAAVESPSDEIAACVSMCAFDSPVEVMYVSARERVSILADIEYPFMLLENYFLFGAEGNTRALDAVNASDTPVMICCAEDDEVVPYDLSLAAHREELTNPNARVVVVPNAGHSDLWRAGDGLSDSFMNEVLAFFDRAAT